MNPLEEMQQTQLLQRIAWMQAAKRRKEFLKTLNTKLDGTGWIGKQRSRAYSDAVVAYDKENMRIW